MGDQSYLINLGHISREALAELFEPGIIFDLPERIRPGEPLTISYTVYATTSARSLGFVSARAVFRQNGDELFMETFAVPASQSRISRPTVRLAPRPEGAAAFWTIGQKELELEIRGFDAAGSVCATILGHTTFEVVGEAVDASWIEWVWPPSPRGEVAWKSPYTLSCALINRSDYARLSLRAELQEMEISYGTGTIVARGIREVAAAPGARMSIEFDPITQNWNWLIRVVWQPTGPMSKIFRYRVRGSLQDAFGNSYDVISDEGEVNVSVSGVKIASAISASVAVVTAAGFAAAAGFALAGVITALGAPALGAAAATAYAVASALGTYALDPPVPDPDFITTVNLDSYQGTIPKFALAKFFAAASQTIELVTPFNAIQGKILGAQKARDEAAIVKQHAGLAEALALMDVHHADMQDALPEAQRELEALLADPGFIDALKASRQPDTSKKTKEMILNGVDDNKELADIAMNLLSTDADGLIDRLRQIQPIDILAMVVGSSVLKARTEAAALI